MVIQAEFPVSFAVSVTDLTAQSPWAAHMERKPFVTLRWITEGRSARSQALLVTSTSPGNSRKVSSLGLARAILPHSSSATGQADGVPTSSAKLRSSARFLRSRVLAAYVVTSLARANMRSSQSFRGNGNLSWLASTP